MTRDELRQAMAEAIALITEGEAPELREDTHLVQDLGLDSLALAELAAKLRRQVQVRLRPAEFRADLRVGAVLDLVLSRLEPQG